MRSMRPPREDLLKEAEGRPYVIGESYKGNAERGDTREKRIERLDDHAGGRIYSYCATHSFSSSAVFSCRSTVLRSRMEFK